PDAQRRLKQVMVADALRRIGRVADPVVADGPALPPSGFRTTLRLATADGRAGFRRVRSHDVVPVDDCLVAHPLLQEVLADLDPGAATELTLRCGARTGER